MRIAVMGAGGMLGRRVVAAAEAAGHVVDPYDHERFDIATGRSLDLRRPPVLEERPDVLINCAGIIPDRGASIARMIDVNAHGPGNMSRVAASVGARLVHVSTDCVFTGRDSRPYRDRDNPDARDPYGMTKRMGEMAAASPITTIVRTSFVGPDHGLWAWAARCYMVEGYLRWWWSGSTASAVAAGLVRIAEWPDYAGRTVHLATAAPMSKARVLEIIGEGSGHELEVRGVYRTHRDLALTPTDELTTLDPFSPELVRQEAEQWRST